jgi:Tfp pilus assembly protein PilW
MDSLAKTNPLRAPRGFRKGFSLVELMVAATEGSILTALVLGIFTTSVIVSVSVGNYSDMHDRNKVVMTKFERDFREASRLTAFSATGTTAEVLTISDLTNGTGTTSSVIYAYDEPNKAVTRNGLKVLSDVQKCSFAFFDGNDAVLTPGTDAPQETRKVLITASMRRTNLTRLNSDYLVSAVVVLRSP